MDKEIVDEVKWTPLATQSFNSIISYLESEFSGREIERFISKTNSLLTILKEHPQMGRPSQKRKNVRIALLTKNTQMVYHYEAHKRKIRLLLFWNSKRDPAKFNY